ncbi:putative membrane protein [Mycobacterium frederiksbergense]|uniref:Membrane protein n=1 Tax=Mycolicibacterium frederiksbergense TaxID=117567 RepID=A0ABT6L2H4_9MYCO|nr:hypothetical protein [Mycolicibacterium frederiksbergense]MDH6196412.1 putative membrane protein [Mycolicibacterium frederiksbergense]
MTKPSAVSIDWVRAITAGSVLGGVSWAVVMRLMVADGAYCAGTILCIAALLSVVVVGAGGLLHRFSAQRTAGVAIILAPLTGWLAILIFVVV